LVSAFHIKELERCQNKIADQQKPSKFLIAVAANFSTIDFTLLYLRINVPRHKKGKILRRKKMRRLCLSPMAYLAALLILFNFVLPDAVNSDDGPPGLKVVRITPAGTEVPPARQIVFEFDRAVVPVGRMERDAAELPMALAQYPRTGL
jgi:hypothetical protein